MQIRHWRCLRCACGLPDFHYSALAVQTFSGISKGRPQAADAAGKGAKQSRSSGLLQDIRNVLDSLDDLHNNTPGSPEQEGFARYNSLFLVGIPSSFTQRTVDRLAFKKAY